MHQWPVARTFDHGLRTRTELHEQGYDDRALGRAVRRGELHRVRTGAYIPAEAWSQLSREERHRVRSRAVLLHSRCDAALSHTSAALELGIPSWGMNLDPVHLTRFDDRAGRRHADVIQHQGAVVADDLTMRAGLLITSGTRTALDLCRVSDPEPAVVAVSGLLHAGETTSGLLAARYETLQRRSDSLGTQLVLALADGRIESVAEGRFLHLCWAQHLPRPEPQFVIRIGDRVIARMDFAWPELKTWVEIDGESKYRTLRRPGESVEDVVIREKWREDELRRLTGYTCVRLGWRDYGRPASVADEIRRAFSLSGR